MEGWRALVVALFACSCLVRVHGLTISHWDLEGANRTCDGRASCERIKGSRRGDELDWRERNCFCDQLCSVYGDCCPDSEYFKVTEQRRGAASFTCKHLKQFGGIYMKTSCPPEWEDLDVRRACEMASEDIRDPLTGIPATSHDTGYTYSNLYCAICHNETDLEVWHPRLECPKLTSSNVSSDQVYQTIEFDEEAGFWGVRFNNSIYHCGIDPVIPETATHIVRRCIPDLLKTCAVNWTNQEVRNKCESYTSIVYSGNEGYRNLHCAMCNNIPVQYLHCNVQPTLRMHPLNEFNPAAFAVLFDLTGDGMVGKIKPCQEDELYDPFFKKCRAVLKELQDCRPNCFKAVDSNGIDDSTPGPLPVRKDSNEPTEPPCQKFLLEKGDYVLQNDSVFVEVYKRTFEKGEFELRDNGMVEVCMNLGNGWVDKFGIYMGYVTYAGLGISIIFLLLHLTAFVLVSELRNLSGKNLASLCIALLAAYISFMAGQLMQGPTCFVIAIVTYYAFLAAFTWMLTMAFDVWRTLRLATSELRVSAGKQWRKFTVYSLWSWLAPAIIVGAAVFVDTSPPDAVAPDWRPDFGVNSCWFGRQKPLWVFFAAPLAVIMTLNIVFFACSAHMIYSTTSTTRFTASASTQRDFRLYTRLAVVMGLTWTAGLIAGALDMEVLWYVFIALNTLQGLFIFLAFTCTDKVIRGLALRRADDKPLRPPSFSWSSDSTRKSHMGSDHGFAEDSTSSRGIAQNGTHNSLYYLPGYVPGTTRVLQVWQ